MHRYRITGMVWRFGAEAAGKEILLKQNGIQEVQAHQLDRITAPNGRKVEFNYWYGERLNRSIPSSNDDVLTTYSRGLNKEAGYEKFESLIYYSEPAGPGARDRILDIEKKRAKKYRNLGYLKDNYFHSRP